MTAKEKARQLVERYYFMLPNNGSFTGINSVNSRWEEAKKCTLIAVEEIILSNPHSNPFNTDSYPTMDYWLEVKQELANIK